MKIANKLKVALKRALSLELGRVATDKNELVFDGELAVGTEVFVEDENGDFIPAEDGEYLAEDGRTLVVADGKISEIREKEAEEEVEEEVEAEDIVETPDEEPVDAPDPEEEAAESMEDRLARLESAISGFAEGFERVINAIAALEGRVEAIEAKINELDNTPAEEFKQEPEVEEPETPKSRLALLRK